MQYCIKVIAENGTGKEIILDGTGPESNNPITNTLKGIRIKVDAEVLEANSRSSKIVNSVEFTIDIAESTNTQCKDFMDWALASKGADVYRTVHIDVWDSQKLLRSFHLKEMFLDDYNEDYNGNVGTLTIKLLQKPGYASDFRNDTNPL